MNGGRRLKVGVTIHLRAGQQSLWENGIFQNCFFMVMLLNKSPLVERAFLVNGGEGDPSAAIDFLEMAPAPVIDMQVAMDELDIIIELSAQLNPEWGMAFRAKGGAIVGMRVANDYVIDVERMVFNQPQGMLVSGTPYNVLWTLPAFEKTCAAYYGSAFRAPVSVVKHLWSPVLIERSLATQRPLAPIAYVPGRKRWRLGILEPNICSVKTAHLAMLVCDVAHRQDPHFIDYLRVYNGMAVKDNSIFVQFARSLNIVKQGIATFEPRFPIYEVMNKQADAIVAHSWENEQNYIYYEALHFGFPLIHNSHFLMDCGYFYNGFDCDEGALALRQAFAEHDRNLTSYEDRSRAFVETLNPESDSNVGAYSAALARLVDAA